MITLKKIFRFVKKLAELDYEIYVATSDITGAGTDAKVFIRIYGELVKTERIELKKSSTHRNKFEKGNVDRFSIRNLYLGDIYKIKYEEIRSRVFLRKKNLLY